jgi:hypothetical protein
MGQMIRARRGARRNPTQRTSLAAALAVAAPALLVAGCSGRVLQVARAKPPSGATETLEQCRANRDACELPGVPFYTVKYRCVHTTVWLQPVYAVALTVTEPDNKDFPPQVAIRVLGKSSLEDNKTQTLLAKIKATSTTDDYAALLHDFEQLPQFDLGKFDGRKIGDLKSEESKEVALLANNVKPERYVDTQNIYYYNVSRPVTGSVNAEIDLNEEGVLTKASAEVVDTTLQTILGVLPISSLIAGPAGLGTGAITAPPPNAKPKKYKLDVQIQTKIYKHTHIIADNATRPPCSPTAKLVGEDGDLNFDMTVEDVTAAPLAEEKKPKSKKGEKPAGDKE